jgi:peptidoglycan/xylan/chitin deacetylase (PgdA/CDA1 family)
MYVTLATLEMHLREIKQNFSIIALEEFFSERESRGGSFYLTLDDGWIDNYTIGFPILKKYKIPATIFLPTNLVGKENSFWFQNIYTLAEKAIDQNKSLKFLEYFRSNLNIPIEKKITFTTMVYIINSLKKCKGNKIEKILYNCYKELKIDIARNRYIVDWEMVLEMAKENITFGAHGYNHYILTMLQKKEKQEEIFRSIKMIDEKKIPSVRIFCYPNGDWDLETIRILKEVGLKGAVTTQLGINHSEYNPFALRRIDFHENIANSIGLFYFRIYQALKNSGKRKKL